MSHTIRTAVLPVAGLGTRMLPATKSVPKELMPVYDRPLIQLAVDEAVDAGIKRLIFVSHPSKSLIEQYFKHDEALLEQLRARGKTDLVEMLHAVVPARDIECVFVMQDEPLGLGHAILCAHDAVGEGPFAVLLPDDVLLGEGSAIGGMAEAYGKGPGGHMLATMTVAREDVSKYGVVDAVVPEPGGQSPVSAMVEKPAPENAPSRLAVIGRYILSDTIFGALAATEPGVGGEIQLTDAIAAAIGTENVSAFQIAHERYDCGHSEGLFQASLALRDLLATRGRAA